MNPIIHPGILLSIAGPLSSDLQNGIQQFFQLFGELLAYLMDAPSMAWAAIAESFGISLSGYGEAIPLILVISLGLTGLVSYTVISVSRDISESASPAELMEEA